MWKIGADAAFYKKLAKLDSNSDAARGYKVAVANLTQADDPRSYAYWTPVVAPVGA